MRKKLFFLQAVDITNGRFTPSHNNKGGIYETFSFLLFIFILCADAARIAARNEFRHLSQP